MLRAQAIIAVFALMLLGIVASAQNGAGAILVEVKDTGGQPVRYACVTLVPKEGEILFGNADSRGHLKFKRVAAGNYRIVVKADGYDAQKRVVEFNGSTDTFAFMMQPRGAAR